MLSKWHVHARDYAREAAAHKEMQIAAVWDEDSGRGEQWAQELQAPFFADLEDLLCRADIAAVIVDTATSMHPQVIRMALEHGKHVFSEKVLAVSLRDCDELLDLAQRQGLQLMVSLPRLSHDYFVTVEHLLREGAIGDLTFLRCRLAHDGALASSESPTGWLPPHFFDKASCGGGALMDLGAHPIYLTNRLAGPARRLCASFTHFTGREVEDHAVVVVEYSSGLSGVVEAGFISRGSPFVLELHGTLGTVMAEAGKVRIQSRLLDQEGSMTWREVPLFDALRTPMEQWVDAIMGRRKPHITRQDIRDLTKINEAALLSAGDGCMVVV